MLTRLLVVLLITCLLIVTQNTVSAADCTSDPIQPCPAAGVIQVQELMTRIINISVTLAFMALTVWLVWDALKYFIISGGDPKALAHAWHAVTWAFLGFFFLILAWLALKLIYQVTGADVTQFCIGFPPYCIR